MGKEGGISLLEFQGFDCWGFQCMIQPVLHIVSKWQKSGGFFVFILT